MKDIFQELLTADLEKLVFSAARNKSIPYKRITVRPINLKGSLAFQAEFAYEKKVTHENFSAEEAVGFCLDEVKRDFKQVNARTRTEEVQILAAKADKPRVTRRNRGGAGSEGKKNTAGGASCAPAKIDPRNVLSHNRVKNYIIPDGIPCDFLIELGVMGADGKVFPRSYSKFRQINRYLEIVADSLRELDKSNKNDALKNEERENGATREPIKDISSQNSEQNPGGINVSANRKFRVIDFGCGKAYLTFALYHYLHDMRGMNVEIIGLDLKADVINFCSGVAQRLGYEDLKFLHGDIADYESDGADMVVTLHACDTATDYALANAVRWRSRIILSVPCCQHELFKQLQNPLLKPMLKHGILKERFTEIMTDTLRGLRLEARGYEVDMIEFTSLEHTARNIMIKAIAHNGVVGKDNVADVGNESTFTTGDALKNRHGSRAEKAAAEYDALCATYGLHPTTSII